MKKVVKFIISFLLVFLLLTPITSFALEFSEQVREGEFTYHTIFTRLWEFVQENSTETVNAVGSFILLLFGMVTKARNNKTNNKLETKLDRIYGEASDTSKQQTSVISVINKMIGGINNMTAGYEKMRAAYEKYESVEDDRNRLIGAVMVQNTALLEILSSVYVHNRNLPQGVKDLIVLKYANCMKALDDDKLLLAIVESVREKINVENATEMGESAEIVEAAEV